MTPKNVSQHIYMYHQKKYIQCLSTQSSQSSRSKSKLLDEVGEWARRLVQPVEQEVVHKLRTVLMRSILLKTNKKCALLKK
jgi:hypothetical protein